MNSYRKNIDLTMVKPNEKSNSDVIAEELGGLNAIADFRGLEVYRFQGDECPATLRAIGRLREKVFSESGAGRGGELERDHYNFPSEVSEKATIGQHVRHILKFYIFC